MFSGFKALSSGEVRWRLSAKHLPSVLHLDLIAVAIAFAPSLLALSLRRGVIMVRPGGQLQVATGSEGVAVLRIVAAHEIGVYP